MRIHRIFPLLSLFAALASPELLDSRFESLVNHLLEVFHVPGISIAVIYNGTAESKGYGFSTLPNIPATPQTLWFTGSTTKAFVAAAAAQIVANATRPAHKRIRWSTPLSELLPGGDFILADDHATRHITLEDALSHRSGMPSHDVAYGWDGHASADLVRTMRHLPFTAAPRTTFLYNNPMVAAVGEWVGRDAARPLEDVLRERIWGPLGMGSTMFGLSAARERRDAAGRPLLARGYFWDRGEGYYVPDDYVDLTAVAGAGATISSVEDYALWMRALLDAAEGRSNASSSSSPVTHDLWSNVTSPRTIMDPEASDWFAGGRLPPYEYPTYALGWMHQRFGGLDMLQHSGALTGFGTQLFLLPRQNLGLVTMGNTAGTSNQLAAPLFELILRKLGLAGDEDLEYLLDRRQGDDNDDATEPEAEERNLPCDPSADEYASFPAEGPASIDMYEGVYNHPAYGALNITAHRSNAAEELRQQPLTTAPYRLTFRGEFSPRTWPGYIVLTWSIGQRFAFEYFTAHGEGLVRAGDTSGCEEAAKERWKEAGGGRALECRNEVVDEIKRSGKAVFVMSIEGEFRVERLGLQIEPAMVTAAAAAEQGGGDWMDSMIWFRKQT